MPNKVKEVTLKDFKNRSLKNNVFSNENPTLLMVTWDKCGVCTRQKPLFNKLSNDLFNLAIINITDMEDSECKTLSKLTCGIFTNKIPVYVMYDNKGVCQKDGYTHQLNEGCLKYAHHKLTTNSDEYKSECL
jgi:hypothetical protein